MKRRGRRFPVVVAGAVAVLGAAIAAWWMWPEDGAAVSSKPPYRNGLIKEVKPAAAPKAKEEPKPVEKPKSLTVNGRTHPDFVPIGIQRMRKKVHEVRTNDTALAMGEVPYRSATEHVLTAIFMTTPGNMPPPPTMLNLSQAERENIVARLIDKTEITDKDSEELATAKEVLIAAKKEMLKYLKAGGEPETFLSHYYNELDKAYSEKKLVTAEIMRVLKEDPSIGRDFIEKANESLRQKGISEVELPEAFVRIMESKGE